jgi:diacylglycerol O-acyltransferase
MSAARISTLDTLLLAAEEQGDYAHLGWVAVFSAPEGIPSGLFDALAKRIAERIERAPQLRWKLASVPLGLARPEWVRDRQFAVERHLFRAPGSIDSMAEEIFSIPLRRDRPLWEIWLCEEPEQGRFALIGKVHRCVLEGSGAKQLRAIVLDGAKGPRRGVRQADRACAEVSAEHLLLRGLRDLAEENIRLAGRSLRAARTPLASARRGAWAIGGGLERARGLLKGARQPAAGRDRSSLRSLLVGERARADLETVARACGTSETEVFLAAVAGAMRKRPTREEVEAPEALLVSEEACGHRHGKATARMRATTLELPTEEEHALARLYRVRDQLTRYARWSLLEAESLLAKLTALMPAPLKGIGAGVSPTPKSADLLIVELPGPEHTATLFGCPLKCFHPIAPLAGSHELSIALSRSNGSITYSIHSDRAAGARARALAAAIERSLDELHADARALLGARITSGG